MSHTRKPVERPLSALDVIFSRRSVRAYTGGQLDQATVRSHFAQEMANPEFSIFYDASTLIVICARPMGPFVAADCWLAAET